MKKLLMRAEAKGCKISVMQFSYFVLSGQAQLVLSVILILCQNMLHGSSPVTFLEGKTFLKFIWHITYEYAKVDVFN